MQSDDRAEPNNPIVGARVYVKQPHTDVAYARQTRPESNRLDDPPPLGTRVRPSTIQHKSMVYYLV